MKSQLAITLDYDLCLGEAEELVELVQCQVAVPLPLINTYHNPSLFIVMANWLSIISSNNAINDSV